MIREIKMKNFKAFETFSINFKSTSLLVGPNSAGKSTILTSLRLAEACLRLAKRLRPSVSNTHRGNWHQSYPVPLRDFAALNESVRHNFRDLETTLEVTWKNGCKMYVVWPEKRYYDDNPDPFFYLLDQSGNTPRSTGPVKEKFSTIGVIPTLAPLEHEESILEDDTVKKNISGRLSSRHFRNQLRMISQAGKWEDFIDFADPWMFEINLKKPTIRYDTSSIDVFFTELDGGSEKELVWAGDGVQIWLQLLLHIYRGIALPTLVLDEPEVFLHADLQRRLVRLLESMEVQVVLATHSTEVLAEADRTSIVWVDKTRSRAVRAPKDASLNSLDSALGTAFNLGMAKALRARGVVFVEGKDIKLLKRVAKTLSLSRISEERSLAVVPLNGYSRWEHAEVFGWFLREFLGDSVNALVLLDRDYRSEEQVREVAARFAKVKVSTHVWKRKELESYLIVSETISRLSKCPVGDIEEIIETVMLGMETKVTSRALAEKVLAEKSSGRSVATINETGLREIGSNWQRSDYRYMVCPPKEVLSGINKELQERGLKAVSFDAIARYARVSEIHPEMADLLRQIDGLGS